MGEERTWYLGEWWEREYGSAECDVFRSADGKKRLYVYWDGTKEVKPAPESYHSTPPVCTKCGSIIFRTAEKYYETPAGIFCYHCVPHIYKTSQYERVHKEVKPAESRKRYAPSPEINRFDAQYSFKQLQEMAKDAGVSTTGPKQDLIQRLLDKGALK